MSEYGQRSDVLPCGCWIGECDCDKESENTTQEAFRLGYEVGYAKAKEKYTKRHE
jgi:hypothetical protein